MKAVEIGSSIYADKKDKELCEMGVALPSQSQAKLLEQLVSREEYLHQVEQSHWLQQEEVQESSLEEQQQQQQCLKEDHEDEDDEDHANDNDNEDNYNATDNEDNEDEQESEPKEDLHGTLRIVIKCHVSPDSIFRACFENGNVYLPKVVPKAVSRVDYDPKTRVRTIHFQKGHAELVRCEKNLDKPIMYIKEKINHMDVENLIFDAEVVDGGFIGVLMKRYSFIVQMYEGSHHDTCIIDCNFTYEALSSEHKLEVPIALKTVIPMSFMAVEAYLLANEDNLVI